ncbi:ATP-binding protein [Streptomyces sp. NPDC055254]
MNPPTADETREPACGRNTSGATPTTAAAARERVGELLRRAGISLDSVAAADALLVTSELVTNAIRHGGGVTAFHADIRDDALHLSVADPNPRTPAVRTHSPAQPGGFGWPLVQHLAEHVDISSRPDGKTITTTLRLA